MKRQVKFPAGSLRAFTHRRTTKDVDGSRHDVWCTVGRKVPGSRAWYYVRFDDGTVKQRHYQNLHIAPTGLCRVPELHESLEDTTLGFWWINAKGTAERPATSYEIARAMAGDEVPAYGWTLLDGDTYIARHKTLPIGAQIASSEVENADQSARTTALLKRRERRRDHAAEMVVMHERAERRHKRLAAKWRAVLKRTEIALKESNS